MMKKYLLLYLVALIVISGCIELPQTQAEKVGWDETKYEEYSTYYDALLFNYDASKLNQSAIKNIQTKGYLTITKGKTIEEWLIDIPKDKSEFEKTWYLVFYYFQKAELEHKKFKVCSDYPDYASMNRCEGINKVAKKAKDGYLEKAAEYRQKIEEWNPSKISPTLQTISKISTTPIITSTSENLQEKLPTTGKYIKLNTPSTYEHGKVKITEFLKFNCGHCYTLNPQLLALKKKYGDNLSIEYKPMLWKTVPQDQGFRKSIEAYILAERMGKGDEMKDALFKAMFVERKDLTSEIVLGDVAKSIGLGDDLIIALKNGDAKDEAEANTRLAESFLVDETPTIIINGNLKVMPMTNEDMAAMASNLDTIIASLLS